MKAEKKEINIQIGKRLQTARENSGYTYKVNNSQMAYTVQS